MNDLHKVAITDIVLLTTCLQTFKFLVDKNLNQSEDTVCVDLKKLTYLVALSSLRLHG